MEVLIVIENRAEAYKEEKRQIAAHKSMGFKLKNRKEGRRKIKDKRIAYTFMAPSSIVKAARDKMGLKSLNRYLEGKFNYLVDQGKGVSEINKTLETFLCDYISK